MSNWISVGDRLPKLEIKRNVEGSPMTESKKVFVLAVLPVGDKEDVGVGVLCSDEENGLYWDGVTYEETVLTECHVTHWCEIPKKTPRAPQMNDAAKAAMREYHRRWRKEHPENIRAAQERYWERRAEREQRAAMSEEGKG